MWKNQAELDRTRNGYNSKGQNIYGDGCRFQDTKGPFAEIFPCTDAVNPQFSDYYKRFQSFREESWYRYKHTPSAHALAAAGLFYLRDRDRCKCYYCNGGIQNWEPGDDPMVEHAKYFPQCEFVLQHKGPDFVAELNARFPNLWRPGIPNSTSQSQQRVNFSQHMWNTDANHQPGNRKPPVSQDGSNANDAVQFSSAPRDESNQQRYSYGYRQDLINQVSAFGFDRKLIMGVLARRQQLSSAPINTLGYLIDELNSTERNHLTTESKERMDIDGLKSSNQITEITRQEITTDSTYQPNLRSQLQSAVDESMCLTCHKQERSCLFMNCGHLSCCYDCGKNTRQCPICHSRVSQTIKIYKT